MSHIGNSLYVRFPRDNVPPGANELEDSGYISSGGETVATELNSEGHEFDMDGPSGAGNRNEAQTDKVCYYILLAIPIQTPSFTHSSLPLAPHYRR